MKQAVIALLLIAAGSVLAHLHVSAQTYHPVVRLASPDGLIFTGVILAILGGGNPDRHPQGRYMPLQLSAALLGLSPIAIRFPQLICLLCVYLTAVIHFRRYTSAAVAVLAALMVCALPVALHVGALGEFSVWALLAHILAFATILRGDRRMAAVVLLVIACLSLVRISSVLSAIPISVWLVGSARTRHELLQALRMLALFVVCLIPLIGRLIALGNPAIGVVEAASTQPLAARLLDFLSSLPAAVANATDAESRICLALGIGMILLNSIRRPGRLLGLCIAGWLLGYVVILSSVKSEFWGVGRYQGEWLPVLVFLGTHIAISKVQTPKPWRITAGIVLVFVTLAFINLWRYQTLELRNLPLQELRAHYVRPFLALEGYYIKSEWTVEFQEISRDLLKTRRADEVLLIGTTYAHVFPLIYAFVGVQQTDLRKVFEMSRSLGQKAGPGRLAAPNVHDLVTAMNDYPHLTAIVIGLESRELSDNLTSALVSSGWVVREHTYGSRAGYEPVAILERGRSNATEKDTK